MNPVLVDTSFLVSIYDRRDSNHKLALQAHESLEQPLVTCEAVLSEALHLLSRSSKAVTAILAGVEQGVLEIPFRLRDNINAVRAIVEKYRDVPASFADACLIHMADLLDTGDILTLDSDFKHYRWRRNRAFRLLIPLD